MIRGLVDLALHRYIRTGELVHLYKGEKTSLGLWRVTVKGWGIYAAVAVGQGYVRRDQIVKDSGGTWTYRFEE